jgi:predicted enzyme related to lactoylglutathione lyase
VGEEVQVPQAKTIKNRIHLCLRPETSRDEEVGRLLDLGATFVADHRNPDGSGWAILADPEGNEFCVLRSRSACQARQRSISSGG